MENGVLTLRLPFSVGNGFSRGQSNLTKGCIAAAHGRFSHIRQVAPICTQIGIRTVSVLYVAELLCVYRPRTCRGIGRLPSWFLRNQIFNRV